MTYITPKWSTSLKKKIPLYSSAGINFTIRMKSYTKEHTLYESHYRKFKSRQN